MTESLLEMGVTGRPHGIKGEISVDWRGEKRPEAGSSIYLQAGGEEPVPWRVASSRIHNGKLLLTLDGIQDRTAADGLKGRKVLAARSAVTRPGKDEAFVQDLPGSCVYLPGDRFLGTLRHVEYPAGKMIWAIVDQRGNEILFPAEPLFIKSIDMQKRRVTIDPPPGLLDIYRA